ncbi:MAG: hypothetical protein LBL69_06535, partial [Zoogloeaceae bacterium]|nr:hypothetical protein [Zoogloeaceae bacterium]
RLGTDGGQAKPALNNPQRKGAKAPGFAKKFSAFPGAFASWRYGFSPLVIVIDAPVSFLRYAFFVIRHFRRQG